MLISRIEGFSNDGISIVHDETDAIFEIEIPCFKENTIICQDTEGRWVYDPTANISEFYKNQLQEIQDFYYATKSWLPYKTYKEICRLFPTNCYTKFIQNPYYLCDTSNSDDKNICDFRFIDANVVLDTFDKRLLEMKYAIRYALQLNENMGHTWMFYEDLDKTVRSILILNKHTLHHGSVLPYLLYYQDEFYYNIHQNTGKYIVARKKYYETELSIYQDIKYLNSLPTPFPLFQHKMQEDLSAEQNKAIQNLITEGGHISILTGGPGTGKTTITRTIVDELNVQYPNLHIHLLAPTGKAAKRIQEVFGDQNIEVSTIHRFLGFGHKLKKSEINKIAKADIIIIDEFSMADIMIFARLLECINLNHIKLILIGDVDQLPSIGAGNLLADLIRLDVHTECLTENYRSQGCIIDNGRRINNGNIFLQEDDSFQIVEIPDYFQNTLAGILNSDIVITPFRVEGDNHNKSGSALLINKNIQKQKMSNMWNVYNGKFRVGDDIIMIRTNYKVGYFNGETGTIITCFPGNEYLVSFGDRTLTIKNADDMELGYAVTVHKSQGSEYEHGVICVPKFSDFYTRRMLYTAITRMKRSIIILGNKTDIQKIILNNKDELRHTFLGLWNSIKA